MAFWTGRPICARRARPPRRHLQRNQIVRRAAALAAAAAAAAAVPITALAADHYYLGPTGGSWNNAANWNTLEDGTGVAGVPAPGDNAFIRGSTSKTIDFD